MIDLLHVLVLGLLGRALPAGEALVLVFVAEGHWVGRATGLLETSVQGVRLASRLIEIIEELTLVIVEVTGVVTDRTKSTRGMLVQEWLFDHTLSRYCVALLKVGAIALRALCDLKLLPATSRLEVDIKARVAPLLPTSHMVVPFG